MKKILALILSLCCLLACVSLFTSCSSKSDTGPIIHVYMPYTTNFDPALAYNDTASAQFLSLIYQRLTTVDANGKLQKSMAKGWKLKEGNVLEIYLNESYWNDTSAVTASNYVFAWKRILEPEFESEAASLLFGIKNAVEVKNGDCSIDDLRLYASGTNTVTVELIDGYDYETFLYNCASVALSPLRSDSVTKVSDSGLVDASGNEYYNDVEHGWSTLPAVMNCNGPFFVKKFDLFSSVSSGANPDDSTAGDAKNPTIVLERNKYYKRPSDTDISERRYVKPYRIYIDLIGDEASYQNFENGKIVYDSAIPLANLANLSKKKVEANNAMATYSFYFNTTNPLFADKNVRTALSMVIDREYIVNNIVYFGTPAEGLISEGVFDTTRKTSFVKERDYKLKTTADMESAKALLNQAKISGSKSFTLSVRDTEIDKAIAEYVKSQWEQLGFKVNIKALGVKSYSYYEQTGFELDEVTGDRIGYKIESVYTNLCKDLYNVAFEASDFDVIAVDFNMLTTNALSALSMFGTTYSGGRYDLSETADVFEEIPHLTGYASDEYTAIITAALFMNEESFDKLPDSVKSAVSFKGSDLKGMKEDKFAKARAELMHQAEEWLLNDMPVIPVYYMQNVYAQGKKLSKISVDYFGNTIFTLAKDRNYKGGDATLAECILPSRKFFEF